MQCSSFGGESESTTGAYVEISNGSGWGEGGELGSVLFANVTAIEGTGTDDTVVLGDVSGLSISGGSGFDTIELTGSGLLIDSTAVADLSGIEVLDISGSGVNTLVLTGQDVVDMGAGSSIDLYVKSDLDGGPDQVILWGAWQQGVQFVVNDTTYDLYTSGDVLASIAIDHDANVQITSV